MPSVHRRLGSCALYALLLIPSAVAQSLTTTYVSNNGGAPGWGAFFDITVLNPAGLRITRFDVNLRNPVNTPFSIDVYLALVSYIGKDTTPSAWFQLTSGSGLAAGADRPSSVDTGDILLPRGTHGLAIYYNNGSPVYTDGNAGNQYYANADAALQLGIIRTALFGGLLFTPRVWNGTIHYANRGTPAYGVFGAGCRGTHGVPALAALNGDLPRVGRTFSLGLQDLPPSGGGVVVAFGAGKDQWLSLPLPFDLTAAGMPGCALLVDPALVFAVQNTGGSAQLQVSVPNDQALVGGLIFNQAMVLDSGANAFGAVMTNGGEGVIGS
jgi:hypothetical protein